MNMKRRTGNTWWLTAILTLLPAAGAPAAGAPWRQYANPDRAGWSSAGLAAARAIAEEAGATAVMVVEDGVAVAAWGPIDRPFPVYSMRKGLYNALVGMLVAEGRIRLDATVGELGLDEAEPLTEMERSATVEQLLAARSGVYRVAAYEPGSMKRSRPERGSHPPGEYWFYNNWDFNALAAIIERASDRDLAALFEQRVALPLGMEDFAIADTFRFLEPSRSRYPAIIFSMSARDLARFGQLYLQRGVWRGRRLLETAWIEESWTPRTQFPPGSVFGAGGGFGYLWWIYPVSSGDDEPSSRPSAYLTRGAGGQVLAVVPALDLVVVHLVAAESGDFADAVRVIEALIAARSRRPSAAEARTVELDPQPLGDPPPAPERRTPAPWPPGLLAALTGEYALGPEVSFTVHQVDGRLFALPRGAPLAEVELFVDASGTVFSPAVDLALEIVRNPEDTIVALEGRMEGRPVRITRAVGAAGGR